MKEIVFSRNSFWIKYWKFITFDMLNLPTDTCTLRKHLILYTLFMLVTLPYFIVVKLLHRYFKVIPTINEVHALTVLPQLLTVGFAGLTMPDCNYTFISIYFVFFAGIVIGMPLALFTIFKLGNLILFICKPLNKNRKVKNKPKKESVIKVLYTTLKDKICCKIKYVD